MNLWKLLGLRRKRPYDAAAEALYEKRIGARRVEEGEGYSLVRFDRAGALDYEAYKEIQTLANKSKLDWVSVHDENIAYLCRLLEARIPRIEFVLCHGTRNGAEQRFFQRHLSQPATILGTEISDTATQFPMTIQWDFHEVKPEWVGAVDVVFSNSWDHSYDPEKLFRAWLSCLRPNGILCLEWSSVHGATEASAIDPFRADVSGLLAWIERVRGPGYRPPEVIGGLPRTDRERWLVFVQRER